MFTLPFKDTRTCVSDIRLLQLAWAQKKQGGGGGGKEEEEI
jgi:hypothetical protein